MLNLGIAILLSLDQNSDQCAWYLVNLLLDTTLGVLICYLLVLILNVLQKHNGWKYLEKGIYFEEYTNRKGKKKMRLLAGMYFAQLLSWIIIVIIV